MQRSASASISQRLRPSSFFAVYSAMLRVSFRMALARQHANSVFKARPALPPVRKKLLLSQRRPPRLHPATLPRRYDRGVNHFLATEAVDQRWTEVFAAVD